MKLPEQQIAGATLEVNQSGVKLEGEEWFILVAMILIIGFLIIRKQK